IRREDVMGNTRWAIAAMMVCAVSSAAHAQPYPYRNTEVGGAIGSVASWWTSRIDGGDVRVTVPVAPRGDVEILGAYGQSVGWSDGIVGFYGGQYRLALGGPADGGQYRLHCVEPATGGVHPFVTLGAIGLLVHWPREPSVQPPVFGMFGGGVERRLLARLTVRAEAQAMMLLLAIPAGVRVAAGV